MGEYLREDNSLPWDKSSIIILETFIAIFVVDFWETSCLSNFPKILIKGLFLYGDEFLK